MSNQFDYMSEGARKEMLENQGTKVSSLPASSSANPTYARRATDTPPSEWQAIVHNLLQAMVQMKGSDLIVTAGVRPSVKLFGEVKPLGQADSVITPSQAMEMVKSIMNEKQKTDYFQNKSCNFAISIEGVGRFRVNAFTQQGRAAMVLRVINTKIPSLESLSVPPILKQIIMQKRGLIIVVGATGSGKTTTMAAMLGYHNKNRASHIITIEDPIEFVHDHEKSIVNQREIGVDTPSWEAAIEDALREAPDVILIGEVRSRETMEHAISFAETGHLCLCTLHANNANQALDRIVNFFPEDRRDQLLMDLSLNLNAIVSQRLIPSPTKGRVPAVEVLLKTPYISNLIFKGDVPAIKDAMKAGKEQGMLTFDHALFDLYENNLISFEDALRNADSAGDLKLEIKLKSKRGLPKEGGVGNTPINEIKIRD